LPGYVEAKLTLTEVRSDGRLQDLNLERKEGDVKLDYEKGLKSEALKGFMGPGITKETKSEGDYGLYKQLKYKYRRYRVIVQKGDASAA
jgi:hypothetical protein